MRWIAVLFTIAASGCSFLLVHGPAQRVEVIHEDVECTRTPIVPIIDAAGGVALASVAVGGVVLQETSSDGEPKHFSTYYAAPLIVGSIIYFIAASYGNTRVTWCGDLKERLASGEKLPEVPLQPMEDKPIGDAGKKPTKPPAPQATDEEDPNKKK